MMAWTTWLRGVGCVGLLIWSGILELRAASGPNVILLMADDLGWGDVGFNGNTVVQTPHLDALSRKGIRFDRFYSGGPVCSPTRGSCLTGRHPTRLGIPTANAGHLKAEETTLAEVLKANGYRTGHFGKWHLGTLTREVVDANRGGPENPEHFSPPWEHGFEVCFSTESKVPTFDPMRGPAKVLKPYQGRNGSPGGWWDALKEGDAGLPYGTYYWDEKGQRVEENLEGDDSRVIMDRAVPFIRKAVQEQEKFFAVIWFHSPHLPVVAGEEFTSRYAGLDGYTRNYYGCISALDRQVGRLWDALMELGVEKHTMIWFCSDNGPEGQAGKAPGSAGNFRGRKRALYEGGIRVPSFLVWPDQIEEGRTSSFPAFTSDYFPTMMDYLELRNVGAKVLDGISLRGMLEGREEQRTRPMGFFFQGKGAWMEGEFKGVGGMGSDAWELYRIEEDPSEKRDLAQEFPEIVKAMKERWREWHEECLEDFNNGRR